MRSAYSNPGGARATVRTDATAWSHSGRSRSLLPVLQILFGVRWSRSTRVYGDDLSYTRCPAGITKERGSGRQSGQPHSGKQPRRWILC